MEKDMVAVIFSAQMLINSCRRAAVVHQIRKPFCTSD